MADEYISREAVMDALLHEQYGYLCEDAIKRIPAADVVPAKGLTTEAKDIVRLMPYAVNALAEKLIETVPTLEHQ